MFSHIMIGSNDMARSKKFYDALFAAVGGNIEIEILGERKRATVLVDSPYDPENQDLRA